MHIRKAHIATIVVGIAVIGAAGATLVQNRPVQVSADVAVGTANLAIDSATAKVGEEFTVKITLDTGSQAGNNETSGTDVVVAYDPDVLEVMDSDPATPGTQIEAAKVFDIIQANKVNAQLGQISFSAGQQPTSNPLTADNQLIATVHFKAKAAGRSPLHFDFTSGALDDSNIIKAGDGRDLLSRVQDGVVTVTE